MMLKSTLLKSNLCFKKIYLQSELNEMEARFQEIIKENERLHLKLEHSDGPGGPTSMTEWFVFA